MSSLRVVRRRSREQELENASYEGKVRRVTGRSAQNLPASGKATTAVQRRKMLSEQARRDS